MSEDFDIREEELEFVAQPYLFEPRKASQLTIFLHPASYIASQVTLVAQVDLRSIGTVVWQKLVILVYKDLNTDTFLRKTHHFASEGIY